MTVGYLVSYPVKYPISFEGLGFQKSIVVLDTLTLISSNPILIASSAVVLNTLTLALSSPVLTVSRRFDVIEANFFGVWLESHWIYGGPDDAINTDEIKFFDC